MERFLNFFIVFLFSIFIPLLLCGVLVLIYHIIYFFSSEIKDSYEFQISVIRLFFCVFGFSFPVLLFLAYAE